MKNKNPLSYDPSEMFTQSFHLVDISLIYQHPGGGVRRVEAVSKSEKD